MLAIIENRWDIKYIRILPTWTENARKILEKVFVTKKFTQCKALRTLKIDVFEIPDNKKIGKFFPKYKLLFLDQANFSSHPSQKLILQFCIHRASLPSSPSLSSFTLASWNTLSIQYSSCSSSILCYPHSTTRHHKYLVYQTICQSKTIRFSIKLYADHNTLWVKHATHQKAESLRGASLWKLDNAVNKNSIFNTKYAEFSAKCKVLLHFHNSICAYNHPYNLHQKFVPLLPSIFNPLFHPYLLIKSSSQFPLELPSCIPQQFFTTLFLRTTIPKIYTKNIFPTSAL